MIKVKKKLFFNLYKYNLLSVINIFISFLFMVYLGKKYGVSSETDIYFSSVIILSYLGYFVQAIWEAVSPYYISYKINNNKKINKLYSILLNDIILISFIIIIIYFVIINYVDTLSIANNDFFNIFIFYIIFQNILYFNKIILNLEHYYAIYYLVDILINTSLLIIILLNDQLIYLAYAAIISTFFAMIWQFYLIFYKINIVYEFIFYEKYMIEIYKNSTRIKIGSLLYGSKDLIIMSLFSSYGIGVYSLYSYANKFSAVILQIINTPIINMYVTQANYFVENREYNKLRKSIKTVLMQSIILFTIAVGIVYLFLPFVLSSLFSNKFNENDIMIIKNIFLIMAVFALVIIIESPFSRLINIVKNFNYGLLMNIIFTMILIFGYLIFKIFDLKYYHFLYIVVIAQSSNLFMSYRHYVKIKKINSF